MSLELLNTLRAANGKAPLKAWKDSKAKLEAAIAKESPKTLNVANELTDILKDVNKSLKDRDNKKPAKKDDVPAPAKPKKSVASKEGKSTAQILKDFGINPKVGRALLRRHGVERTEAAITKFLKGRSK